MATVKLIRLNADKLYRSIFDIFELDENEPYKHWDRLKNNLKPEQVRALYLAIINIWPEALELSALLPDPSSALRSFYIGRSSPESVSSQIAKNALYTDEIVVTSPFLNPLNVVEEYNPAVHPEAQMSQTFENLGFMLELYPWHKIGKVLIIPTPIHYTHQIFDFVFDRNRVADLEETFEQRYDLNDPDIIKDGMEAAEKIFLRIPQSAIEPWVRSHFSNDTEADQARWVEFIKKWKAESRFTLNSPHTPNAEFHWKILGAPTDVGILLGEKSGSYLYTDYSVQWEQILKHSSNTEEPELWSPITKAFQELDFKFLDKIKPEYAADIVAENRLPLFRTFMRDLWRDAATVSDPSQTNNIVREFSDQMSVAYAEAQKDWDEIDKKLGRRFTTTATATVTAMSTGRINMLLPLSNLAIASSLELLLSARDRKNFKATKPMAIFIELNKMQNNR